MGLWLRLRLLCRLSVCLCLQDCRRASSKRGQPAELLLPPRKLRPAGKRREPPALTCRRSSSNRPRVLRLQIRGKRSEPSSRANCQRLPPTSGQRRRRRPNSPREAAGCSSKLPPPAFAGKEKKQAKACASLPSSPWAPMFIHGGQRPAPLFE